MYDSTVAGWLVGRLDGDGHTCVQEFATYFLRQHHNTLFEYHRIGICAPDRPGVCESRDTYKGCIHVLQ